jgi:hypothetical protein
LNSSAPKPKLGRPRKTVAPEALTPFGKHEVTTKEKLKSQKEKTESSAKKPSVRRMNPTTSDRHYTSDELEFMNALAEFKRASGRTFPTCSEILGVLRQLGYEKVT